MRSEYSFPFAGKPAHQLVPPVAPGGFLRRPLIVSGSGGLPADEYRCLSTACGLRSTVWLPVLWGTVAGTFFPFGPSPCSGGQRCRFGVRRSAAYYRRRPVRAAGYGKWQDRNPWLFSHSCSCTPSSTGGNLRAARNVAVRHKNAARLDVLAVLPSFRGVCPFSRRFAAVDALTSSALPS
jgi:hypothetical protein